MESYELPFSLYKHTFRSKDVLPIKVKRSYLRMMSGIKKSRKFFTIAASLGVISTIAACGTPETTTTTTAPTTTAESPATSPAVSPAVSPTVSPTTGAATSGTVAEVLSTDAAYSTLRQAVQAAGLETTLSGTGPFTVFAPTNEAFAALPAGTLDKLLLPENKAQLQKVLSYHVLPSRVTSAEIQPGKVNTVEGQAVTITSSGGSVTVNDATVSQPDISASNGVIHGINKVLLPPDVTL
jgi:uncharacterized surface protein with fasciclin (FAS1) repeats